MKRRTDLEDSLLELLYHWLRPIRVRVIKRELEEKGENIPHSTLNSIIKRLEEEGLVKWEKYGPISLTAKGRKKVAHRQKHFHLLVMFLMEMLNLPIEVARRESHPIASVLSCELIDKIDKKLDSPERCFCNEPIPKIVGCPKRGKKSN